jgi:hypothetical protein
MKTLLVVLALVLCGCSGPDPQTTTTLPSGQQLKVPGVSTLALATGGAYLVLDYQTDQPIDDAKAMGKEADEIWVSFRSEAEGARMKHALIRAHEAPNAFWSRFGIVVGKRYGSAYDKAEDGTWPRSSRGS